VSPACEPPLAAWFEALEARHLGELTFAEVRRALQALSSLYVERRGDLAGGGALDGAGKRAAFALFYGPLHFELTRRVLRSLGGDAPGATRIADLGCGTGAAGAAWGMEAGPRCEVAGLDRSGWAVEEARWTYRALGVRGSAERGDAARATLPGRGGAAVAAFTVNELTPPARDALRARLLAAGARGVRALVLEPLARRALPWWDGWEEAFVAAGGRADGWRFPAAMPDRWRLLDRAAGLDHRVIGCRSLYLPGRAAPDDRRG
jgi:SAM-dependent methyltransferase